MSQPGNDLRPANNPARYRPIAGGKIAFPALPGWVLLLTHDGERSLGVWTNGRAIWPVPAGQG
jgi:hypothetical protein